MKVAWVPNRRLTADVSFTSVPPSVVTFLEMDSFDVVAVGIEDERRVAIAFPSARLAIVFASGLDRRLIEALHFFAVFRQEGDMDLGNLPPSTDPEARMVSLHESGRFRRILALQDIAERLEHGEIVCL